MSPFQFVDYQMNTLSGSVLKNLVCVAVLSLIAFPCLSRAQYYPTPVGTAATTNCAPYYYTGRVHTMKGRSPYIGTGTVIKPRSVLTCGHVLWNAKTGWATGVYFDRALSGSEYRSRTYANSMSILGGYTGACATYGVQSKYAYDQDLAGLRFATGPAGGGCAGWWANTALLTGTAFNMSLGYGGERHTGVDLLRSSPSRAYTKTYGGYYQNNSYQVEGGMSGGPVFAKSNGNWFVCAVNVSGLASPASVGIRALDSTAQTFINTNLR